MYTASPAQGRRMPNAPRKQIAVVGQRRRVAGEGLRRSWGQRWTRRNLGDRLFDERLRNAGELNPIGHSLLPDKRVIG